MCCSTKLLLRIKVSRVFREKSVLVVVLVVVVVVVVQFLYYFFSRACINGHRWAKKRFFVSLFLFPLFCFFSHTHQVHQKSKKSNREETRDIVSVLLLRFFISQTRGKMTTTIPRTSRFSFSFSFSSNTTTTTHTTKTTLHRRGFGLSFKSPRLRFSDFGGGRCGRKHQNRLQRTK